MAEYSSKLELCSFGLTKSFIPLGFVRNTKVFPLGFVIFDLSIPLGFIRNDNEFLCVLKENVYFRTVK